MENIYTQAVADAKAVRESAMANAKAAIQEAFEPKIKAMLKKHIVENEGLNEGSFTIDYNDADYIQDLFDQAGINAMAKQGLDSEEVEIHGDAKSLKAAKRELGKEGFEIGGPATSIGKYRHDSSQFTGEYNDMRETEMAGSQDEASPNELDETDLDSILAELDSLEEADELEEAETELDEAYEMEEAKEEEDEEEETEEESEEETEEDSTEETKVVDITLGDLVDAIKAAMGSQAPAESTPEVGSEEMPADDDISLDEILAELEGEMEEGGSDYMEEAKKKKAKEDQEMKAQKELKEAKKAIATMRAELNEINLLNAKLLYVNKIFKAKTLTEAQKVKVLNAFDRATTIKEVKNTFSIVNESITAAPKKQLKESYGFASKPSGMAPKGNTVDSDPFLARMQKLAGL